MFFPSKPTCRSSPGEVKHLGGPYLEGVASFLKNIGIRTIFFWRNWKNAGFLGGFKLMGNKRTATTIATSRLFCVFFSNDFFQRDVYLFGCLIISNMKSLPAGFAALVGSDVTVFGATLWLLKFRAEWNGKERLFFFYFPHFSLMERSLFVSQFV